MPSHRTSRELVAARGGTIVNVDVTVVCERPKIAPHRGAMQERIAEIRREYKAKLAEKEIAYESQRAAAVADPEALERLERDYLRDREFLESQREAQIRATADPELRRAFVPYVETSRDKDREAAEYIERAVSKLSRG